MPDLPQNPRARWSDRRKRAALVGGTSIVVALILAAGLGVRHARVRRAAEAPLMVDTAGRPTFAQLQERAPRLMWRLRPNLHDLVFEFEAGAHLLRTRVSTNALHLRYGVLPEKGRRFRILALGDSTTFGLGVADAEAWPAQFEAQLRAKHPETDVINAGCPGYTVYQGLERLKELGPGLRPDLVLASFGHNDVSNWSAFSDMESAASLDHPALFAQFLAAWRALPSLARPESPRPRLSPGEFVDCLLALRAWCDANQAELVLIVWPVETR